MGMSKLDEIKHRVERFNYFKKEVENTPLAPGPNETGTRQKIVLDELHASEKMIEARALQDVQYLLSKIEIAQAALEKVFKNAYLDVKGEDAELMLMMSGNISEEALQKLRS